MRELDLLQQGIIFATSVEPMVEVVPPTMFLERVTVLPPKKRKVSWEGVAIPMGTRPRVC